MNIRNFIIEALRGNEFKEFMRIGRRLANKRIDEIWPKLESLSKSKSKRGDRLYFEYDDSSQEVELPASSQDIIFFLQTNGYKVTDYIGGFAIKDGKQLKISKILLDLGKNNVNGAEEAFKAYNKDTTRSGKNKKLLIVVSRHPYDIAGASTDRGWSSCMNLRGGDNSHYIEVDVQEGTIISYLIDETDLNINNPIARILIKPYLEVDNEKNVLYGIERNNVKYGSASPSYIKTLIMLLDKIQQQKTGYFKLVENLYPDGKSHAYGPNVTPIQQFFMQVGNSPHKVNEDNTISIFGDAKFSGLDLTDIPFKIRDCTGDFQIYGNKFVSLKNTPTKIGGGFTCAANNLSTLEGGPKYVENYYFCDNNKLKTLKGCPSSIGGDFNCEVNLLTSLNFGPNEVDGDYDCSNNKLTSLHGAPLQIKGDFNCSNNNLHSLSDGPKIVFGHFLAHKNNLSSLEGSPKVINGAFSVEDNPNLKSINGLPDVIGEHFIITNTPLVRLFTDEQIRAKCKILGKISR